MSVARMAAFVGITLASAACAAPPAPVDPQGIQPAARFGPVAPPQSGQLRVKTETHVVEVQGDVPHLVHGEYDVFDAAGRFVRHVDNHISDDDQGLMTVSLVPGRYLIAIPQGREPKLWVEVTIEDGRLAEADVTGLRHR